jgi:hypothetical protein
MKVIPIIISMILASSTLGYGLASATNATPCTASYPCAQICGDHPCAPGEVYVPSSQGSTKTNVTANTITKTNVTANTITKTNVTANTITKTNVTANTITTTNGTASPSMTKSMNKTSTNMTNVNGTMNKNMTEFMMPKNTTMVSTGAMEKMNKTKDMGATGAKSSTGMMEMMAKGKATGTTGKASKNNGMNTNASGIMSPRKQIAQGISPGKVQCKSGYQLILNKFDSRPACVSPAVLNILTSRGWG